MVITLEVVSIMSLIEIAVKALCVIFGIICACTVTIPKLRKALKQRKNATTEAEKAEAELAIRSHIVELIGLAETNYASLDKALKSIGESAGSLKKDKVMSDMRDFCDEKGYAYDKDAISKEIDDYVALTNVVNTNKQK